MEKGEVAETVVFRKWPVCTESLPYPELGYREIISEKEGALRTLESSSH
jgi:hypothetical protein